MSQVRVLYDFVAETPNEISTSAGEELTVIDSTSYEGWIKTRNSRGEEGIVPSSYVEYIEENNNVSFTAQQLESDFIQSSVSNTTPATDFSLFSQQDSYTTSTLDDNIPTESNNVVESFVSDSSWETSPYINQSIQSSYASQTQDSIAIANQSSRISSEHWSSDEDFQSTVAPVSGKSDSSVKNNNKQIPASYQASTATLSASTAGTLTKHKNKNSFGLDVFLLCGAIKDVPESEKNSTIIFNEYRQSVWKRRSPPYHIRIINTIESSKYYGTKKFVLYEIQTEKIQKRVKRRYNHFDWLHSILEEKYPNICIPPLPDKAVTGNFEEEFIAKRKTQLELWLNRLSSHPVISESEVFIHFLQCDDTESKWKTGKRKAEKDEYRGAQWFCTLTVPGESFDTTSSIKEKIEKFSKASISLDNCVKNFSFGLEKLNLHNSSTCKKELINFGKIIEDFGAVLSAESLDSPNNTTLSRAVSTTGNAYSHIANLYGEQSKEDIYPLIDRLALYRGIIQQMPDIMQFEKNSIQTYEEFQQKPAKLQGRNILEVAPRREIISHVTFAEINQFNKDKVDDLAIYMKTFLQKQIAFYTEITDSLKNAYAVFEQIPVSTTTPTAISAMNSSNYKKSVKK